MKKVVMNRIIFVIMALSLTGCSTICQDGFKFGPYAVLCAPYDGYKLIQSVHNDLQPSGILNPNGNNSETNAKFANYSTTLAPGHPQKESAY